MASTIDKIKSDFIEALNASQRKTSAYDTEAEVVRIEGNTAWVHIGGGVAETPVALTINAKKGDKVQVRVSNEGAWIMGNATAPPTDDATAIIAEYKASVANIKAEEAKANAAEAVVKANGSVASDTLHYLATSASSGVTINTQGWTTTIQTIDSQKRYLWTYHTYTKANGSTVNTQPVITGTYGVDGTSVTILGSYDTVAELEAAHPTGSLGDAYMVAGDLYVWNGTAWENVGQIQGPKGDTGTSVTSVINYYLASPANTGITHDSPGWTTTIQTMTATNQYLWNYEVVKGTGNVTLNTTNPIIIGRYGQNGQNGISITAVQPQYALSTSASTAPTSGWGNTLVYEEGKYIWTRDEITYSNGNVGHSTAIYNSALTSACVNALNALQIAEDTNQYFWHTETGTDTGAHITEIPQEDFIADPQNGGGNLLARSNGIAVRDGLTELASFSANGIQLGLDTESHLSMDYHSIQAIDKEGDTYFYVSDLRDAEGYAELTQIVKTYNIGGYSRVNVMYPFVSPDGYSPTVTIEGVEQEYTYTSARNVLQLTNSVPEDTEATVVYKTTTTDAKAYTLGFRNPDYPIGTLSVAENKNTIANGGYSHAEGLNTTASRIAAHAEGGYTIASGQESHAEGSHTEAKGAASHAQGIGTIASREAQTALGSYNIEDTPAEGTTKGHYAVIVGNGRQGEPSNAFMLDWNGDIYPQATKMTDFIVEQGTSGSWTYRKWNTGVVEAWAQGLSLGSQSSSVWVSPIRYKDMTISIPSGIFTSAPTVTMTSATNQWWVVDGNATSATSISSRFATLSSSSQTLTVNIYARG